MSCCICRSLLGELLRLDQKDPKDSAWIEIQRYLHKFSWSQLLRAQSTTASNQTRFISASLSEIYRMDHHDRPGMYRLDFKLKDTKSLGTFILQRLDLRPRETGDSGSSLSRYAGEDVSTADLHTPFSDSTKSDEVLSLAKFWIEECSDSHISCPGKGSKDLWLPTRLIDLGEVPKGNEKQRESSDQVRLVITKDLDEDAKRDQLYVTLSHCWGKAEFLCLLHENLTAFQDSIQLTSLPPTFRDAIYFARRLHKKVRYIWIDSLCIIQRDRPDWLTESSRMYKIYCNSYCNLSATASSDSQQGLFFPRKPHELWEDDVNLNVEGIPGQSQRVWKDDESIIGGGFSAKEREPGIDSAGNVQEKIAEPVIERCRILDVAFWERHVDDAPVNRRGWVLQERLMAPRVLHFCKDQTAWECRHLEAAESSRAGLPIFRVVAGDIVSGGKLKSLIPHYERDTESSSDPFQDPRPEKTPYDNWTRIVEVYSKTKLTKAGDKLIALSGIAQMMYDQMKDDYLAGMWRRYLESQLLWRVDPIYKDGKFEYPSQRPEEYRAPSFSWAAVDAENGITCGEITDKVAQRGENGEALTEGLLIMVERISVIPVVTENVFGLVQEGGDLVLSGMLKKVEMQMLEKDGVIRYAWNLVRKVSDEVATEETVTHRNVYLDSPKSDLDIIGPNGKVFCLPARKDTSDYLICLMLQLQVKNGRETGKYRRVGLTKIPPYQTGQNRVLELSGDESEVPYGNWNMERKRHTIFVV